MEYKREDFILFSNDAQRITANLEQSYAAWVESKRQLEELPISMFWKEQDGVEYLAVKQLSNDSGTTVGRRSANTGQQYQSHIETKSRIKQRISSQDAQLTERAGLYRRLRLPSIPDRQAEILRRLDVEGMLGTDLMVVGSNAFIAYELACGARFPTGNEETEDFDLAWCRGTKAALISTGSDTTNKSLFTVLKSLDSSYTINKRKPYQAV